jgi:hypothetical protein
MQIPEPDHSSVFSNDPPRRFGMPMPVQFEQSHGIPGSRVIKQSVVRTDVLDYYTV